jgi:type I thyroxine 5'-deiodinase
VYIREAHPSDAWQTAVNVRENIVFSDPRTFVQRNTVAESCVRKLGIRIPALVDDINDAVERNYDGWPDRLYVIDREGRVAYKSAPGPFGFHPAGVERTLQHLVQ